MSQLLPWKEKALTASSKQRKTESAFWQQLKRALKKHHPDWRPTRIESTATLGVPDVLIAADGSFGMWELKVCHANAVRISPHQIAFAETHRDYPVWTIVCHVTRIGETIKAYSADQMFDLAQLGCKHTPRLEITPPDWNTLFDLIKP